MTAANTARYRVYWEDTDAAGMVYHANYLRFMERARSDWLRARGFGQAQVRDHYGQVLVVGEVTLRYHAPARLDDQVDATTRVVTLKPRTVTLVQDVLRAEDGLLLARGTIILVCVDASQMMAARMHPDIHAVIAEIAETTESASNP